MVEGATARFYLYFHSRESALKFTKKHLQAKVKLILYHKAVERVQDVDADHQVVLRQHHVAHAESLLRVRNEVGEGEEVQAYHQDH